MRRLIIVAVLLVCCVGISVYAAHHVEDVSVYVCQEALRALDAIGQQDEDALAESIEKLQTFWEEEEKRLAHLVNHAQVNEITKSISRLKALEAVNEFSELAAELAQICWQIESIRDGQQITLSNLL